MQQQTESSTSTSTSNSISSSIVSSEFGVSIEKEFKLYENYFPTPISIQSLSDSLYIEIAKLLNRHLADLITFLLVNRRFNLVLRSDQADCVWRPFLSDYVFQLLPKELSKFGIGNPQEHKFKHSYSVLREDNHLFRTEFSYLTAANPPIVAYKFTPLISKREFDYFSKEIQDLYQRKKIPATYALASILESVKAGTLLAQLKLTQGWHDYLKQHYPSLSATPYYTAHPDFEEKDYVIIADQTLRITLSYLHTLRVRAENKDYKELADYFYKFYKQQLDIQGIGATVHLRPLEVCKETTLLYAAFQTSHYQPIRRILEAGNLNNLQVIYKNKQIPLLAWVCLLNNYSSVQFLLNNGIQITFSALRAMIDFKHNMMLEFLLKKGNKKIGEIKNEAGQTLLHVAAKNYKAALFLLLEAKIDPKLTDNLGNTPLHYASRSTRLVRYLMKEAKVDVDTKNEAGKTPLYMFTTQFLECKIEKQCKIIKQSMKILLYHGAKSAEARRNAEVTASPQQSEAIALLKPIG